MTLASLAGAAFEWAAPGRVLFGRGALREVPAAAKVLGRCALVVTGREPARAAPLIRALGAQDLAVVSFSVDGEPTVDTARAGVATARDAGCDLVIGIGGGSALDAAKAIAALLGNGGDPLDYLEVVGRGQPLVRPCLPFIAIPTTAGTGSEVTKNAVLASPAHRVKASLRSPLMLARLAVVDPDLLIGLPPPVIASSGLDALSQLIEPLLSLRANPLTDSLAREGIRRSARSLRAAFNDGVGADAGGAQRREDLALASLFGGLCLANAGLGAVHGLAAPLGGMFSAPHGAVCAALLPHAMVVNHRAITARSPESPASARMREVAALLTGNPEALAADGVTWIADLCHALAVPGLGHYGMTAAALPGLVAQAKAASSMKGNPIPLTDDEIAEIARAAL